MPKKQSSQSKPQTEQQVVSDNSNVEPQTEKPVKQPKQSKKSKQQAEAIVDTQVSVEVSDVEPVEMPVMENVVLTGGEQQVEEVAGTVEQSLVHQSNLFLDELNAISNRISRLRIEFRSLEKRWLREMRTAQKSASKKKRRAVNRQPSGFVKPTKISDELATFLGKEKGSEMARTEVTRDINKYIRTHNLQDKENGRKINPDKKLCALLKLGKDEQLTYFNLQKYMSPHFAKSVKDVKEATA